MASHDQDRDARESGLKKLFTTIPNYSLLDQQLNDTNHLANIASCITDWPTVFPYLPNLKINDKEDIQHDCGTLAEERIGLLNKWKERNGPRATYRQLAESLYEAGRVDAVQKLCELLGAPKQNSQQESNPALEDVIEESYDRVQSEFAALLLYARKKLEKNVSPDDFRTVALSYCSAIEKSSNVGEMFNALTCNNVWNYRHCRSLRGILLKLEIKDPKFNQKFVDYMQLRRSHDISIKIVDWIKGKKLYQQDFDSTQPQQSPDCSKLSVKLHPYKVTDKTLQYIRELWETIAEELLELPDLDAVLYDIKEGCISVTWLIPAREELKYLIRRRASCCQDFFRRHSIVLFMLNDEYIYKEQPPGATYFHIAVQSSPFEETLTFPSLWLSRIVPSAPCTAGRPLSHLDPPIPAPEMPPPLPLNPQMKRTPLSPTPKPKRRYFSLPGNYSRTPPVSSTMGDELAFRRLVVNVCERLSKEEVRIIVYTRLYTQREKLKDADTLEVFHTLECRDVFSPAKPEGLLDIVENDLHNQKVASFISTELKKMAKKRRETSSNPRPTQPVLDHSPPDPHLRICYNVALAQANALLQHLEVLRHAVEVGAQQRDRVNEAIEGISNAASELAQVLQKSRRELGLPRSLSGSSTGSSTGDETSTQAEEYELPQPPSTNSQGNTPTQCDRHSFLHPVLPRKPPAVPPRRRVSQQVPIPEPPTEGEYEVLQPDLEQEGSADSGMCSGGTGSGDGGFTDARRYRKPAVPPRTVGRGELPGNRQSYKPLERGTLNELMEYTTINRKPL